MTMPHNRTIDAGALRRVLPPAELGSFPEDSFHGRVQARIAALAALARDFGHPDAAAGAR